MITFSKVLINNFEVACDKQAFSLRKTQEYKSNLPTNPENKIPKKLNII
jgi:hypothetical protein